MLLRPSDVMQFDDAENPTIIEDFIKALGEHLLFIHIEMSAAVDISLKEKELAGG